MPVGKPKTLWDLVNIRPNRMDAWIRWAFDTIASSPLVNNIQCQCNGRRISVQRHQTKKEPEIFVFDLKSGRWLQLISRKHYYQGCITGIPTTTEEA